MWHSILGLSRHRVFSKNLQNIGICKILDTFCKDFEYKIICTKFPMVTWNYLITPLYWTLSLGYLLGFSR